MTPELMAAIIASIIALFLGHCALWFFGIIENTWNAAWVNLGLAGAMIATNFVAIVMREHYIQNIDHLLNQIALSVATYAISLFMTGHMRFKSK